MNATASKLKVCWDMMPTFGVDGHRIEINQKFSSTARAHLKSLIAQIIIRSVIVEPKTRYRPGDKAFQQKTSKEVRRSRERHRVERSGS